MAVGLSTSIAAQSIMIMGGVLKIMPLTGVTLPFISYGGSSLLVSFIMAGLLLRLSATQKAAP
jgi:cell division protein FtsW (lipid II flippase)